ncbi:hypothetical protein HJC99_04170 [Candidatus Saccharibacteria bacterium]|nr:hypothetical protein [Candidatus Saccharibacteria bacterium]
MKLVIIWVAACLVLGIGGGLIYLNRPSAVAARVQTKLADATPNPQAGLVTRSFRNKGHVYRLSFFADALVATGSLARSASQDALLVRPGHTPTSYGVIAAPLDDNHSATRSDCGTRTPTQVAFTVQLYGNKVSVCHGSNVPYGIYVMDLSANGTWQQIILFNNGLADMTKNNAQLKTILSSLTIN